MNYNLKWGFHWPLIFFVVADFTKEGMSSQLNYTDLMKQALQSNINPVETVENHIPITGPSN